MYNDKVKRFLHSLININKKSILIFILLMDLKIKAQNIKKQRNEFKETNGAVSQ